MVEGEIQKLVDSSVFDNMDMGRLSINNIEILTVMRCEEVEWRSCPASVTKKFSAIA